MRKIWSRTALVLLCAALVCVTASTVRSQGKLGFDLGAGMATPVGDFNDGYHLGLGVHSSVYVEFSPVAAAGLGGGFNWFTLDGDIGGPGIEVEGGKPSIINICPELRFMVGTADMPTFIWVIGAGYYRLSQSDLTLRDALDPSLFETFEFEAVEKFGINTSGKVVFPVATNVKLGFETMFHLIFSKEDNNASGPTFNTTFFDFMVVLAITPGT